MKYWEKVRALLGERFEKIKDSLLWRRQMYKVARTVSRWSIMLYLLRFGEQSKMSISMALGIPPSNTIYHLEKLEEVGIVIQKNGLYSLTKRAKKFMAEQGVDRDDIDSMPEPSSPKLRKLMKLDTNQDRGDQ